MLIESKFRYKVAGPVFVVVMILALVAVISFVWAEYPDAPFWPMMVFYIPMAGLLSMMIFGEMRKRTIKVTIDTETITVRGYMGWGREKLYFLNSFNGYHNIYLESRYGRYEYLYLIRDGKKVVKLSDFYHKNFEELKAAIAAKVKYAGPLEFHFFREIREFFD